MALVAFSSRDPGSNLVKTLSDCQHNLEDELILITEFNKTELEILVNFCTEGILPLPLTKLKENVPIKISRVFAAFGISLEELLFKKVDPKQEKVEVKIEI